ncbi:MAG: hypothetical protein SO003_00990 [Candidatus Borkfalkiaceae bacterium]|nr:hypothetical protein [Christensenellaceae bacterium]
MTRTKRKRNKSEYIFCGILIIPFVLHFAFFWFYANLESIKLAFSQYDLVLKKQVLLSGSDLFKNFKNVINDLVFGANGKYFLNGVYMHLMSTFLCLPLSYMVAFMLYKRVPGAGGLKVIMYLPHILSGMFTVLVFVHLFESGFGGFWQQVLHKQFPYVFTDPKYVWLMMSTYIIFYGIPGSLLINLGTMARIPDDLVEYGILEGISMWKEFCLIVLPMTFSVIEVQCLGLFVGFFTTQGPLFTFYGSNAPKEVATFGYWMYIKIATPDSELAAQMMYGYTSAAQLLIGLAAIPIVQLTKKLFDFIDPQAEY